VPANAAAAIDGPGFAAAANTRGSVGDPRENSCPWPDSRPGAPQAVLGFVSSRTVKSAWCAGTTTRMNEVIDVVTDAGTSTGLKRETGVLDLKLAEKSPITPDQAVETALPVSYAAPAAKGEGPMLWQPWRGSLGIALLLLVAWLFLAGSAGRFLAADRGGPGYAGGARLPPVPAAIRGGWCSPRSMDAWWRCGAGP